MRRWHQLRGRDDGVSLVLALVFMLIVSAFLTVTLERSQSTSTSGQQVRVRGEVQYTLDGAVEKAFQELRADVAGASPALCRAPGSPESLGTLELTHSSGVRRAGYSCQTLSGRSRGSGEDSGRNYAIVVTGELLGDFTTDDAVSTPIEVQGSVYTSAPIDDLRIRKEVEVDGDLLGGASSNCAAWGSGSPLTKAYVTATYFRGCTPETEADIVPLLSIPAAPPSPVTGLGQLHADVPVDATKPDSPRCRVFAPGRYSIPPAILSGAVGANYFVSGLYYFNGIGGWTIPTGSWVIGGAAAAGDLSPQPPNNKKKLQACKDMTDDQARAALLAALVTESLATADPYTSGVEWVFGGNSSLVVHGDTILHSPSRVPDDPASIYGARPSDGSAWTPSAAAGWLIETPDDAAEGSLVLNGRLFAPDVGRVKLFASEPTDARFRRGIVAERLDLQASAAAGEFKLTAAGDQPRPALPFRTIKVVAADATTTTDRTTAVATISNDPPYEVRVVTWRTGSD